MLLILLITNTLRNDRDNNNLITNEQNSSLRITENSSEEKIKQVCGTLDKYLIWCKKPELNGLNKENYQKLKKLIEELIISLNVNSHCISTLKI